MQERLPATSLQLEIYNALLLQLLEEQADVGADLLGIGLAELLLQVCHNLSKCALAIAAFEHLSSSPLQLDCAFRKHDHAGLVGSARRRRGPARPNGKAGTRIVSQWRHLFLLDPEGSGGRPGRLHIGEVQRIKLGPENVALVTQSLKREFLLPARLGILVYELRRKHRIFGCLRQTSLEIIQ